MVAAALLAITVACVGQGPGSAPAGPPTEAPDLEATVQAAVSAALPGATETLPPSLTPDISATVAAGIAATQAAAPTPTLVPSPTPDIDATVEARMAATIAAAPTATPVTVPTEPPSQGATQVEANTPVPQPTPTPTPSPRPTLAPAPISPASMTLSDMVNQVRPAVVRIGTTTSVGTGVIFETSGRTAYVITNEHVVSGHREVTVVVNDSDRYRGSVLGVDSVRDLAVVSVCCGSFHSLSFGDAAGLRAGDEVIAIGYALGLSGQASITRGIVSAIRYDSSHLSDVIQTDAAINPGNSGGPMLSMSGEILGINTFSIDQSRSGRPAEGLGFAVSGSTVQARIPQLRTAAANPTPTPVRPVRPTRTPSPRPAAPGDDNYVFGPVSGNLRHDPGDGFAETFASGVSMLDVAVSGTFVNPYSASRGSWDYGFVLRSKRGQASVRALVRSAGGWEVTSSTGSSQQDRKQGTLSNLNVGVGQRNTLVFFAIGTSGLFFVNGEFVSLFDLSRVMEPGDVSVITGAISGNEIAGAVTTYQNFQVLQFEKQFGPTDNRLQGQSGRITEFRTGLSTRDLVIETEFVNPSGANWDYGFVFRNPAYNLLEVVGLTGEGNWFHTTRTPRTGGYDDRAEGRLADSGVRIQAKNHLMLLCVGDAGLFVVNGKLVGRLDLTHNRNWGNVIVFANFLSGHRGSPSFSNLNVWTP